MSRLMSVALTTEQVRNRTKTVTRRLGWKFLKPGDIVTLCEKVQGRRKGDPLVRICDVEIVEVTREPLHMVRCLHGLHGTPIWEYDSNHEVRAEGFPDLTPDEFVEFFCKHMKCTPDTEVTRIEWRYLEAQ